MKFEWDEEKILLIRKSIKFLLKRQHIFLMILITLKCLK